MKNKLDELQNLCLELIDEFGLPYLIMGFKQINDRQSLFLDFSYVDLIPDPILKVLDVVVRELEWFFFESDHCVESMGELKQLIDAQLQRFLCQS